MNNRLLLLFTLLAVAFIAVSCAPASSGEEGEDANFAGQAIKNRLPSPSCSDSDGNNPEVAGTTTVSRSGRTVTYADKCVSGTVISSSVQDKVHEFYCDGSRIRNRIVDCPEGCAGGACLPAPIPQCTGIAPVNAELCNDDDNGLAVDTAITLVASCTDGIKCEFVCAAGFTLQDGACVTLTNICGNGIVDAGETCSNCPTDVPFVPQVETVCDGNTLVNRTYTACDAAPAERRVDCTAILDYPVNRPMVCTTLVNSSTGASSIGCYTDCVVGSTITTCGTRFYNYACMVSYATAYYNGAPYNRYWGVVGSVRSCPAGTTCQSGICA